MSFSEELPNPMIGERMRQRRKELGLSMAEVGERLGLNKSTIQRYEANGIRESKLLSLGLIARALETSVDWLLGKIEYPGNNPEMQTAAELQAPLNEFLISLQNEELHPKAVSEIPIICESFIKSFKILLFYYSAAITRADAIMNNKKYLELVDNDLSVLDSIGRQTYRTEMEPAMDMLHTMVNQLGRMYGSTDDDAFMDFRELVNRNLERIEDDFEPMSEDDVKKNFYEEEFYEGNPGSPLLGTSHKNN